MPKPLFPTPIAAALVRTGRGVSSTWLNIGTDLCFPPRCTACQISLPDSPADNVLLCDDCRSVLVPDAMQPMCRRCGALLEGYDVERLSAEQASAAPTTAPGRCRQCRRSQFRFMGVVCLGRYVDEMRLAVLRMKRASGQTLAAAVGELLWQSRQHLLLRTGADLIVPVPTHWTRRWVRGSNSAETLGGVLGRRLRIGCPDRLLFFRRKVSLQSGLSRSSRIVNVRGALKVRAGYDLSGARVLLVDDVLTTGATCNEAARRLIQAGAARVTVAVAARSEDLDF